MGLDVFNYDVVGQISMFDEEERPAEKEEKGIMNVLVACEESQAVCKAFRKKGHRAFSCDLQKCSGGHPEWHINYGVLPILGGVQSFRPKMANGII